MRIRFAITLLAGTALVVPIGLSSQTTASGGLAGIVSDPSGAAVPGATVKLVNIATQTVQIQTTDKEGSYQFFFLAPGDYSLAVSHPQLRIANKTVRVAVGPAVTLNVVLQLPSGSTTVTVTDDQSLLRAENGDVSAAMNQQQISELPNPGNDLTYGVQTAPGVVMNTDVQGGANFSILGMPGFSYLHTIDGMNDNDNAVNLSQVGALILLLGQNEVQEAGIVTTGYSGQFGGAAGGNINYVTKSGSNSFHGNLQYYWNGRILNANDWFANAFQSPRPFSIANQWAGSLGGPIKKNVLFFFFDSEGLRITIPQKFLVTIPSAKFETATLTNLSTDPRFSEATLNFYRATFRLYDSAAGTKPTWPGATPYDPLGCSGFVDETTGLGQTVPCSRYFFESRSRPSQDALVSGRLDWNIGKNDRVFFRLQYDGGQGAIATDPISPLFDADFTQPWFQGQIQETHGLGSSATNQLLLAGSYFAGIYQLRNPTQALAAFPTTLNFVQGPYTALGGGANITAFGYGRYNAQYQVSDDVAKITGNHNLGFGGLFERINWSELPNRSAAIGHLDVQTLRAFFEGGIDPATPDTDFSRLAIAFTSQGKLPITFSELSVYANDEWHIRPALTLTFALRAEHYSNPVCQDRCFARLAQPFESLNHDPAVPYTQAILVNQRRAFAATDSVLWSPRFSLAWQPFGGSHTSVVRAGFGIFYDPLPGRFVDSYSGNPPLLNSYSVAGGSIAPDESSSLFETAMDSNAAFLKGFYAGENLAQIKRAVPDFTPPAISDPGKRTRSPQYQRWSLEWQRAITSDTSVTFGYYGHHGIHGSLLNPNMNAFGFGSLSAGRCSRPISDCAPDPRFSQMTELLSSAISNYNGAIISFQHRINGWGRGIFQANYTYGHALDEVSSSGNFIFTSASLTSVQDPGNPRGSYGSADHDVRHSLNANYVWELPLSSIFRGHGHSALVNGWQISGTIFARTGFPYTVFDYQQSGALTSNNYFGLLYAVPAGPLGPDPACGEGAALPLALHPCQPAQVQSDRITPNPQARFIQAGCATDFNKGNLPNAAGLCNGREVSLGQGRNRFRGPHYFNSDFSIMKNTKLPRHESIALGIGLQFFNVFNHPNFGFPDAGLSSSTFGQISSLQQPPTSILGSGFGGDAAPRMIQIKAQLQF